jgi:hypothetical protein
MSNSARCEAATANKVNEVMNNETIIGLVKTAFPDFKGGVYPSDCAYKRDAEGKLVARGKTAYGDGVFECLGENSFKRLPTDQVVRRPSTRKTAVAPPATPETPAPVAAAPAPAATPAGKKKAAKATPAKPPAAPKQKANHRQAAQ